MSLYGTNITELGLSRVNEGQDGPKSRQTDRQTGAVR